MLEVNHYSNCLKSCDHSNMGSPHTYVSLMALKLSYCSIWRYPILFIFSALDGRINNPTWSSEPWSISYKAVHPERFCYSPTRSFFPELLPQGSPELGCQEAAWLTFTRRVCTCLGGRNAIPGGPRSGLTHLAALPHLAAALPVRMRSFREVPFQHSPGFLTTALFTPSVPGAFVPWCLKFHLAFKFAYTSRCLCLLHISLSFYFSFWDCNLISISSTSILPRTLHVPFPVPQPHGHFS